MNDHVTLRLGTLRRVVSVTVSVMVSGIKHTEKLCDSLSRDEYYMC